MTPYAKMFENRILKESGRTNGGLAKTGRDAGVCVSLPWMTIDVSGWPRDASPYFSGFPLLVSWAGRSLITSCLKN
jgi:hypothetical protein